MYKNFFLLGIISYLLISCTFPSTDEPGYNQPSLVSVNPISNPEFYIANEADFFTPYFLDQTGILKSLIFIDDNGDSIENIGLVKFKQVSSTEFYVSSYSHDGSYIINPTLGSVVKIDNYLDIDYFVDYPLILRGDNLYWTDGSNVFKYNILLGTDTTVAALSGDFGSDASFYITKNGHIVSQLKIYPKDGSIPISLDIPLGSFFFYGPNNSLYVHYVNNGNYKLCQIDIINDTLEISVIKDQYPGFSLSNSGQDPQYYYNHPFSTSQTYKKYRSAEGYVSTTFSMNNPVVTYHSYASSNDYYYLSFFYEWHITNGSSILEVRNANNSESYVQTINTGTVTQYEIFGPIIIYERYVSGSVKKWFYKSYFSNQERELPIYIDNGFGLVYTEKGNL